MFALVFAIIAAFFAIIFALQNGTTVDVRLFNYQFAGSLALVILITFAAGVLVGYLFATPAIIKRQRKISHQYRQIRDLESVVASNKTEELNTIPPANL